MGILLVNGSFHKDGNTTQTLRIVEKAILEKGLETEWFHIGSNPVRGCLACERCAETHHCVFDDDPANALSEAMTRAEGIIIGSPVYFAGPNGALTALLDRVFYAGCDHGVNLFEGKPAAAVVNCWRSGCTNAIDRLNKYFMFAGMPVVSSDYWNLMFPKDSLIPEDDFGRKILETLGRRMAEMVLLLR